MKLKAKDKMRSLTRGFNKVVKFLREVRLQMKKISWPGLNKSLRYTGVVLVASLLLAVFLGGIDFLFTTLLNRVILG